MGTLICGDTHDVLLSIFWFFFYLMEELFSTLTILPTFEYIPHSIMLVSIWMFSIFSWCSSHLLLIKLDSVRFQVFHNVIQSTNLYSFHSCKGGAFFGFLPKKNKILRWYETRIFRSYRIRIRLDPPSSPHFATVREFRWLIRRFCWVVIIPVNFSVVGNIEKEMAVGSSW